MATADTVGQGIRKLPRTKPVKWKADPETTPLAEAAAGDWMSEPQVDNQMQNEKLFRMGKQEAMVLDLSNAADLIKYNEMLTRASSAKANIVILDEQKQFVEKLQSWKVLLKVQHIEYRKLFKKGMKPDSVEAQEQALSIL